MASLIRSWRESTRSLFEDARDEEEGTDAAEVSLTKSTLEMQSDFVKRLAESLDRLGSEVHLEVPAMEIRLENVSYRVPAIDEKDADKIATIYTTSPLYKVQKLFQKLTGGGKSEPAEKVTKSVLSNVNLTLKPQRMYLVLGPPLSGKTSLLKAIAGELPPGHFPAGYDETEYFSGRVLWNNLVALGEGRAEEDETLLKNLVAFVSQSDVHAPRLTVAETFLFSGNCKDENVRKNRKGTGADGKVGLTLDGLGLGRVKDTFVGNEQIRGVSGGQRRRVTLGEMMIFDTPLLCGDEISTGLDTASTVDILRILSYFSRLINRVSVVSLLQPSPEAVALFDEVVLLSEGGHVIYAGPTEEASLHFRDLGYVRPDGMDDADFLLAVASSGRDKLYDPPDGTERPAHTPESLAASFSQTKAASEIVLSQSREWERDWKADRSPLEAFRKKYANSFLVSVGLNLRRSFTLWKRDRIFIRASIIKNIAMGLSVGFVFLNTDVSSSFFGVLFQGNLFIMLGAMTSAPDKLDDRAVFYKHNDSNFYPAFSYVLGQALALVPQMLLDVLLFGTFVYWLVGFVATAGGFLLYLALFFSFNFTMGQLFGLLAACAPNKSAVQAGGAVILLLNVLFCGYIVAPTVIPAYYIWIYWSMPLSWVYRALILNQFTSEDYPDATGQAILRSQGFLYDGEPFAREWIGYAFAYLLPFLAICMVTSAACLRYLRMQPKPQGTPNVSKDENEDESLSNHAFAKDSSFVPVNLSFKDIRYEVKASKGSEKLRLLNNVSGVFRAGRMCALMGESGAGKTTLMDVIAMRKASGNVTGDVLLNGFPQEKISFRRCSGYVEQFDVQSAELTVRETIRFSAQLRLDKTSPVYDSPNGLEDHIDFIINSLELAREADLLVGSEESGGLTFEQKKRLSIAVELAASPSLVFLDEPTSGLDARAAMLVVNALKKMCKAGRTIVSTIHQPSSQVFEVFDDLLLLKKGGETVFFGDLGTCSCNLLDYFESRGATPMNKGENPATWMLNVLEERIMVQRDTGEEEQLNWATAWQQSANNDDLQKTLDEAIESKDESQKIHYDTRFAARWKDRDNLMAHRLVTIYWRSPAYNLSRMTLGLFIAFLLGSIFIPLRSNKGFSEAEITSMLSTIFIAFIIIGVLSITSVLPIMLSIRDMYYRHEQAGMLSSRSIGRALALAEKRFILISAVLFCIVFLPLSGILLSPDKTLHTRFKEAVAFWGFFTFNTAIYSYIGQLFMCLVPATGTAQVLASVFIGINNFFSGLIVRPQQMTGLWAFTYWINPGHFVYEGLCMSVFSNDTRNVIVQEGSDYYDALDCDDNLVDGVCQVDVSTFVDAFFGGLFQRDHIFRNAIVLGCILTVVRACTFVALKYLKYTGK